jgi:hypothetical protein
VGSEDSSENPVPTFSLKVDRNGTQEFVRIGFRKYGHAAVLIQSRRNGGAWETLGIDFGSPYNDERPLLVATAPEIREYRLQFYDGSAGHGDFTAVQSISVAP